MFRKIGKKIEQFFEFPSANVVHVYKEGICVADAMANARAKGLNISCMLERELHVKAFQAWIGDKLNLPIWRFPKL